MFFGIGFETTAPPNAMTVYQAKKLGIENFSLLVSHVRVPPAIEAIMTSPVCRVQAFLAAGHVCTVMGIGEYPALAERFEVPIVVTGFEPLDILEGIRRAVHQLEEGRHEVENAYPRVVADDGNPVAHRDARGRLRGRRPVLARHRDDPAERLAALGAATASTTPSTASQVGDIHTQESSVCRSGEVLQGLIKPHECAAFGKECTPRNPLGATMVSSEGACAAYYLYRRLQVPQQAARRAARAGGELRWLSRLRPHRRRRPELRGLDLPAAAARQPDDRDGPRRRRSDVGRAGRARVPAGVRQRAASAGSATPRCSTSAVPGWRSPPTRSSCGRCSSPAAASATSRSTAPSTTSR